MIDDKYLHNEYEIKNNNKKTTIKIDFIIIVQASLIYNY